MSRRLLALIYICFVVGCAQSILPLPPEEEPPVEEPPPEEEPEPDPFGLTERVTVTGLQFPIDAPTSGPVEVEETFENLGFFNRPVMVTHAGDGTDRIFVVERFGKIYVFDNDPEVSTKTLFLDLSDEVLIDGEMGLLAMAFDPDYDDNGYFYVHYNAAGPRRSVISRFKVSSTDADVADSSSEKVLVEVSQPHGNHNGGALCFGPDDMLYASFGDGGLGGDPQGNGQNRENLLSTVIRIDPHAAAPYIPSDNPFADEGGGVRGEIWAFGFRNPWRMSFDRDTGDLWLGDVGDTTWEEINLIKKGANYGWSGYEGSRKTNTELSHGTHETSVREYGRSQGGAVIGGYIYRGSRITSLRGAYVYGDNTSSEVYIMRLSGTTVTSHESLGQLSGAPAGFGEDEDGELYVCEYYPGRIYTLRAGEGGGGEEPAIPAKLSDTGLFDSTTELTPVDGLIEYEVNSPLWSDGALKRRWMALPGNKKIDFSASGEWDFPVGTVLVKHFELRLSDSETTRLETRVMVYEREGWAGYTYKWNFLQTDADLLSDADTETYTVEDDEAPGGTREQTWDFPSRSQCFQCHTPVAGFVLGLRTRQINGSFDYNGTVDNQLRAWNHINLFDTDIGDHEDHEAMPNPSDESQPVADRARAYLEINCAQCHQPGGSTQGNFNLRFDINLDSMNVVDVRPTQGGLGLDDAFRIKRGSKESSVLWERMLRTDTTRMPRLGSRLVDPLARDLIGRWIDDGAQPSSTEDG